MACRDLQYMMDGTKQRRFNKMNYIKLSIWALAAITLVACSSDDDKDTTESLPPVENTPTSFSASIESGNPASSKATRTTLVTDDGDSPYPVWAANDQLHVYNATTPANALFTMKNTEYIGQRQGVFEGTITRNTGDKFFALYCSTLTGDGAPTLTASNSTATISATIPSALVNYTAGFHPEYHFMTACTTGSTFKFKNAMSLIRIDLSNNSYANFVIRKIHFKAINGENIAGTFTASIGDDGTIGTPSIKSGGSSEIIISNSDGSALATGVYYIPVLPSTLTGGFTLTFENTEDGAIYERSNTKANYTIDKSEIINLGSFTAQACAKEAYVDLGIKNSSGQKILWCVENVYDEGYTDLTSFYAWGETSVKELQEKTGENATYSWYRTSTSGEQYRAYKYGFSKNNSSWTFSGGTLTKYNSRAAYATNGASIDNKKELETGDDVAYQKSNGKWRIPSADDFQSLINAATVVDEATGNELNPGRDLLAGPAEGSNYSKYKIKNRHTNHYITFSCNQGYRFKGTSNGNDTPNLYDGCYWTRDLATTKYDFNAKTYRIQVSGSTAGSVAEEERAQGRMIRGVMYR